MGSSFAIDNMYMLSLNDTYVIECGGFQVKANMNSIFANMSIRNIIYNINCDNTAYSNIKI